MLSFGSRTRRQNITGQDASTSASRAASDYCEPIRNLQTHISNLLNSETPITWKQKGILVSILKLAPDDSTSYKLALLRQTPHESTGGRELSSRQQRKR